MSCADDFFKFLCKWVLENCSEDMKFVLKRMDNTSINRLNSVISASASERISYTEALDILKKASSSWICHSENNNCHLQQSLSYACF